MSKFTTFSGASDETEFLNFLISHRLTYKPDFKQTGTHTDTLGQTVVQSSDSKYNWTFRKTTDGVGYKLTGIEHA